MRREPPAPKVPEVRRGQEEQREQREPLAQLAQQVQQVQLEPPARRVRRGRLVKVRGAEFMSMGVSLPPPIPVKDIIRPVVRLAFTLPILGII